MSKPRLYAVVQSVWGSGDVGGTLYDHEGEPIHGHMSSSEAWLWRDLTIGFRDRAQLLDERYPNGYDVVQLGRDAKEGDFAELHRLWDEHHPGWRDDSGEEK